MTARFSPSLAFWSLGALSAGLILGTLGQVTGLPFFWTLSGAVAPLGALWLNALQMTVIPLVITQLLAATVRPDEGSSVGGLGARAVGLMVGLMVLFGLMTLMVTPLILGVYSVPPDLVSSLRVESIPQAALDAARAEPVGLGEWLVNLIPRNPFEAAARGDILQILVFTVLVGVALGRLPAEQRNPMATALRTLADGMMVLVSWVVWGTPLGVFSLILGLSLQTGLGALGLYSVYLGVLCTLLVLATILLYPITALLGRASVGTFARAVAPAQLVAAGTQSSLASLPALIQGARASLRLSDRGTGFALPLCVSTFKLNQAISPVFKFMLLAHVFGIPLGAADLATYLLVVVMLSFSVAGVPRGGGGFRSLPLYLAAGIPIEGVVILEAVKTIPDVFMTTLNVTADMSVATILTREERVVGVAPVPSAATLSSED